MTETLMTLETTDGILQYGMMYGMVAAKSFHVLQRDRDITTQDDNILILLLDQE